MRVFTAANFLLQMRLQRIMEVVFIILVLDVFSDEPAPSELGKDCSAITTIAIFACVYNQRSYVNSSISKR